MPRFGGPLGWPKACIGSMRTWLQRTAKLCILILLRLLGESSKSEKPVLLYIENPPVRNSATFKRAILKIQYHESFNHHFFHKLMAPWALINTLKYF
jgi:hypothetical protein